MKDRKCAALAFLFIQCDFNTIGCCCCVFVCVICSMSLLDWNQNRRGVFSFTSTCDFIFDAISFFSIIYANFMNVNVILKLNSKILQWLIMKNRQYRDRKKKSKHYVVHIFFSTEIHYKHYLKYSFFLPKTRNILRTCMTETYWKSSIDDFFFPEKNVLIWRTDPW